MKMQQQQNHNNQMMMAEMGMRNGEEGRHSAFGKLDTFDNEVNRIDSEEDFGEGEVEDTQFVKSGGLDIQMKKHQQQQYYQRKDNTSDALSITKLSSAEERESQQIQSTSQKKHKSRKTKSMMDDDGVMAPNLKPFDPKSIKLPPYKSIYDKATLETFPQRTRWHIPDSKVVFSSEFCSGNLARAQRGFQKNNYDLWACGDAQPNTEGDYYKTWFFFSVTGIPQGELITFTFKNLNNQSKLYNQGLKPVFKVLPNHQKKYRRIMTKVQTYFNNDEQFTMQFSHMFAYPENSVTYFAFTFPFSFQESLELTDEIETRMQGQPNCYFNREILYYSLEGRPMELVTISSQDMITAERETIPIDGDGLFPAAKIDPRSRPLRFKKEKPVIFLTSRVHPGETPGSHVLNGFLELLTDLKSEQGRCLRKNYVYKVIMMLNPDGVSRGYYRLDSTACNLNRFYLNPSKSDQPTIWACRKAVVQQAEEYKCLKMFLDFHAHASKKGGFMFGNHIIDQEKQADNITFVKLIAMNCLNFDMNECNFSDKIMSVKDRNGQSREGSSRVAIAKATGIIYSYTLEFNYHSGRRINTLAPKYNKLTGGIEPETEITDPQSKIYVNQASPPFTQQIYEDCGRAVGAALLDLIDDNPISRMPLSCYRTVTNVRTDIMNNLGKYESGNVNVVGANHFAPTNTKVAKAFANTPGPKIKLNGGSAGTAQQKAEQEKLKKAASLLSNGSGKPVRGTFGISKRIMEEGNTNNSMSGAQSQKNQKGQDKKNGSGRNLANGKGLQSRQNSGINSQSQQPGPRAASKIQGAPGSAKHVNSNKKRKQNAIEKSPSKEAQQPKSQLNNTSSQQDPLHNGQWAIISDRKLNQHQMNQIAQELQAAQNSQGLYHAQKNLMSQTGQNPNANAQYIHQRHGQTMQQNPNYTVSNNFKGQQPPAFLISQHQMHNMQYMNDPSQSKYSTNQVPNSHLHPKNLPIPGQRPGIAGGAPHQLSQYGGNPSKSTSPQNHVRKQDLVTKSYQESQDPRNVSLLNIADYQAQVIMQKQQQLQLVKEQMRLQQKLAQENQNNIMQGHQTSEPKVNQSFSYHCHQVNKNVSIEYYQHETQPRQTASDQNGMHLNMVQGHHQKLQLHSNLPATIAKTQGQPPYYNNAQARSKSHIRNESNFEIVVDPNQRKKKQMAKHQTNIVTVSDDKPNLSMGADLMYDNDAKLAELELKAQRVSSKSKTQDKSIGRRSARPKGTTQKKQSLGQLPQERKQLVTGTAKFEGLNNLRDQAEIESAHNKSPSLQKQQFTIQGKQGIPKICLENMDQVALSKMRAEQLQQQQNSNNRAFGSQSQSLMTDNHLPTINQAYLLASQEKQSSGRHNNSQSHNSKDSTIQHSSSRQITSIPLLVHSTNTPIKPGNSPASIHKQQMNADMFQHRTVKHAKPAIMASQIQSHSQCGQIAGQNPHQTVVAQHRKQPNNVSKGQLLRNGMYGHSTQDGASNQRQI